MSPTAADTTGQGCIRICNDSSPVRGSLESNPQTSDPWLITISVRSFTPRVTPIQWHSPVPGSQRDP